MSARHLIFTNRSNKWGVTKYYSSVDFIFSRSDSVRLVWMCYGSLFSKYFPICGSEETVMQCRSYPSYYMIQTFGTFRAWSVQRTQEMSSDWTTWIACDYFIILLTPHQKWWTSNSKASNEIRIPRRCVRIPPNILYISYSDPRFTLNFFDGRWFKNTLPW